MVKHIVKGNGSITVKADDGKITTNISTKGKKAPKPSKTRSLKKAEVQVAKEYKRPKTLSKSFFAASLDSSDGKYLITLERESLNAQFFLTFTDKTTQAKHIIPEEILYTTVAELEHKPYLPIRDPFRLGFADVRRSFFMLANFPPAKGQTLPPIVSRDGKYVFTINEDENSVAIVSCQNQETNEVYTIPETLSKGGREEFAMGIVDGPVAESWKLFHQLNDLNTRTRVKFAGIRQLNPRIKRLGNDGIDSGAAAPVYYLPNKAHDADHLPEDTVLLRWSEPGLAYQGLDVDCNQSGWALCFYGAMDNFIEFAEWNDLAAVESLISKMKSPESLRAQFALANPDVSRVIAEKEAERSALPAS